MNKKILLTATVQSHIAQFHKPLIDLLKEKGYEVHVAARDNLAEKNGLVINDVDKKFNVPFERSPINKCNITAYKMMKEIIENGQYNVIHCNTPVGGIVTRLAARKIRKAGTKVIYTAHGFHFYKGAPKKNWLVYYPVEKYFSRLTDVLITITHEDYALAKEKFHCKVEHIHGVGVDEHRYYPVADDERSDLKKELGFTTDQKIILCVGELLPNKNQKMAIHMMTQVIKHFPNAKLLLAGNGPEKDNLEREIQELGLQDNVTMLGYCTYLEKYQRITDVLVACSKREGLPLNLVEAMLSGNPVVATVNRGHKELIRDKENGYLVNVDDIDALAERVIELLADDEKRTMVGGNAYRFAKQYCASNVTQELNEIYYVEDD